MKASSNSGSSIKRFFIYHCEKLILALSIVLFGLFFYFGYSTPDFTKSTPSKMVEQANRVHVQMTSPEAWNKIREAREGDGEVVNRIVRSADFTATDYEIGPASYPVKKSSLRKDAVVVAPEALVATPFYEQILIQPLRGLTPNDDPLPVSLYETVSASIAGGGGMDDLGSIDDDMMMDDGSSRRPSRNSRTEKEEPVDAGSYIANAMNYRIPGVRGGFAPTQVKSYSMAGVAVTGIVDHQAMWDDFKTRYQPSFGYHPDRDTPRYDYLQVQRREVNDDGTFGQWRDISKQLADQRDYFPSQLRTAPEVVGPNEYDNVITMPIPPFTGVDYKDFAIHPQVSLREFRVDEAFESDAGEPFGGIGDDDDAFGDLPSGRRRGALGSSRDDRMDIGRSRRDDGMNIGGGRFGTEGRNAADVRAYQEVNVRERPESPYKVVRFFDIYGVKPGKKYQYQTRVWLRDPNNEDPEFKNDVGMGNDMMGRGGMMDDLDDMTSEEQEEMKRFAQKTPIASSMIDPQSRQRLRRTRQEDVDGKTTYYVSEPYGEDGAMVEIKIPPGQDYLRYARPSRWSKPIEVKVDASPTFVYAGEQVEVRQVQVANGTVFDGEPSMKIAAGKFMTRAKNSTGSKFLSEPKSRLAICWTSTNRLMLLTRLPKRSKRFPESRSQLGQWFSTSLKARNSESFLRKHRLPTSTQVKSSY